MTVLRAILGRLGRHNIPTPAPASFQASGQAGGGGSSSPVSVGRQNAPPVAHFSDGVPPHPASGGAPYWPAKTDWHGFLTARIEERTQR